VQAEANGTGNSPNKVLILDRGPIREIRLNRPEVHNALDEELISGLEEAFRAVASDEGAIRGVLLSAAGKSFCSGADLHYMGRVAGYSEKENVADARKLSAMYRAIRSCPVFVLARVQGAVLGGGTGLVACADLALASAEARFGFTEVRLGILPAVISPFVLERIGPARARALFPTGEIFSAEEARQIGLVDRVVHETALDQAIDQLLQTLLQAAPLASREAKKLIETVVPQDPTERLGIDEVFELTARTIARMRALPEGREGMAAFLQKRPAAWSVPLPPADGGTNL
jgi:methylglutaconyl-CoA hydratase